ncbi:unnamed protein product [Cylicocyclus nassatus]|uniref:Uncharacterized protein n=1 Tax=Cylicocyclus nassatus TaxID=53992 RepID=A0AA36H4C7_CYLNA|nr:unnamed protein product [Cylicocyclus nassatus]
MKSLTIVVVLLSLLAYATAQFGIYLGAHPGWGYGYGHGYYGRPWWARRRFWGPPPPGHPA